MKNFIPKNKEDLSFIEELKNTPLSEVKPFFADLLVWTQDINWPQASYISDYFIKHYSEVEKDLIIVLQSNDSQWKYSVLNYIISYSIPHVSNEMVQTLNSIVENLSEEDQEEGIDKIVSDILGRVPN